VNFKYCQGNDGHVLKFAVFKGNGVKGGLVADGQVCKGETWVSYIRTSSVYFATEDGYSVGYLEKGDHVVYSPDGSRSIFKAEEFLEKYKIVEG
jgi:hypothetical protein